MTKRKILTYILCLLMSSSIVVAGVDSQFVSANGTVFGTWRDTYPASLSSNASCQLCHMNPTGGDGWNAYGWSIRQGIKESGLSIADAIAAAEALDADGNGKTNLEEIRPIQKIKYTREGVKLALQKEQK
ncbi:hypothetical protein KFU94_14310 [Chloroflexi bacterium TSY]|nr:hypothetical protein [Chloroflexi bacterium TSY]